MSLVWERVIRFEAADGRILYGEPTASPDTDLGLVTSESSVTAKVIEGTDIFDTSGKTKVTDEVVEVKKILGPLTPANVPVLRCIGLNYAKHSKFDNAATWFGCLENS
jgi:hypothetical protein